MANFKSKFDWDRINSTFRWNIKMIGENGQTVNMSGYSKSIKYHEPNNKDLCLTNCIERVFIKMGYFEKAYNIEIFLNEHRGNNDTLLLSTIAQKKIVVYDALVDNYFLTTELISKINSAFEKKTSLKEIVVEKPFANIPDFHFNFHKTFMKNEQELVEYCRKLKAHYGEHQRIKAFYKTYMDLHFASTEMKVFVDEFAQTKKAVYQQTTVNKPELTEKMINDLALKFKR